MHTKTHLMLVLGMLMMFGLSGCFSQAYEVRHNPDGTGQFSIETIFAPDMLDLFEEDMSPGETRDEILRDATLSRDDLPLDDPNLIAVSERDFIDESTGALHHIIEVDIQDMLTPLQFDDTDDFSKPFIIEDYGDGTYLFSAVIESLSEFVSEEMGGLGLDMEETRLLMEGSTVTWQINVQTFIEGDPRAEYDPAAGVVRWEVPLYDALFGPEPIQIFAIYRLEAPQAAQPWVIQEEAAPPPREVVELEPPATRGGLPNWLPGALVAVVCLGLIFVVVVVVVIILVVRKRKNP